MADFPNALGLTRPPQAIMSVANANVSPLGDAISVIRGGFTTAAAWPAANRALYTDLIVEQTVTAYKIGVYNGATVSGNVSVGIYDYNFAQVVEARAAMSGASQIQVFDITDTVLTSGIYVLAMACDNGTATFFRSTVNVLILAISGGAQMATAYPLPSTLTYTAPASSYFPYISVACTPNAF